MIPWQTSSPMKSASSSGPIGWLSPIFAPVSMSSARADALLEGPHRLGEERHQHPVDDEARPVGRDDDAACRDRRRGRGSSSAVASDVAVPRTSSTSGMTGTGLKKCIPTKRAAARRADGRGQRVDRDRARVRGEDRAGRRDAGRARDQNRRLTSTSSKIASTTRSGVGGVAPRSSVGADPGERRVARRRPRGGPSRPPARGCRRSGRDRPRPGRGPARRARRRGRSRRRPGRCRGPSARRRRRRRARSSSSESLPVRDRDRARELARAGRRAGRRPTAAERPTTTRNVAP